MHICNVDSRVKIVYFISYSKAAINVSECGNCAIVSRGVNDCLSKTEAKNTTHAHFLNQTFLDLKINGMVIKAVRFHQILTHCNAYGTDVVLI